MRAENRDESAQPRGTGWADVGNIWCGPIPVTVAHPSGGWPRETGRGRRYIDRSNQESETIQVILIKYLM